MEAKNQQLIEQMNEKRGELKTFIAIFTICAVLALIATIVFFCMKEVSIGFFCLACVGLWGTCAATKAESYGYVECLIESIKLIDEMGSKMGIKLDEDDQPSES